ncbi:MAG: DUF4837 family protein [Bacteroidales bacterium]|nr:DUF4837 family protein [Bacteroidales bacterium]
MKKILVFLFAALSLVSCGNRRAVLLPNISGKAGEVLVVMKKADWEGQLGVATRELLAADCPWLPVREPLFKLVNIAPGDMSNMFKVHRNIVWFDIDPQAVETGVKYLKDRWAAPQCLVSVAAHTAEDAVAMVWSEGDLIATYLEQAERDRIISNTLHYENRSLAPQVREVFGGSPHFPTGYVLKKKTSDFVWIADEKQYTNQAVLIYSYPAEADPFTLKKIIAHRNAIMQANVPGMFENTWMTTGEYPAPGIEYLKYRGRDFAQVRGWWEVKNDFMAGPFVSHSFYSRDGSRIIVAEAFLYAPKYDKRQYLRQVESLLYSWEWTEEESVKK